jgi:hypothetical protein
MAREAMAERELNEHAARRNGKLKNPMNKPTLTLLLDNSFVRAQGAPKDIVTCFAGDGIEGGHLSFVNPTGGTKVISPVLDRKICRSLKRAVGLRSVSLYFLLLLLDLRYLAIKIRYARSRLLRNFIGSFAQMIENARHFVPRRYPFSDGQS